MTRKIGRYEILGPLASGGMAEIMLARLVGPSGFERPVVIKRIRPDLQQGDLVTLFLEEARLAAKVRHANVVAVEDLGTDEGAPYLVMEYLEGESLSNVTRRLKARDETIPFGLIAYVVAEACAGLHAAHELRDLQGELVGLVHRDVSPQNVFVTYGGAVKIVDFGIARTGASPSTDPGTVRGKFGYMAPEQLKGERVDRRTDVFALGIVLYELLTGHRLFKRFSPTAAARAVLSDPIVAPRRVEPAVPAELESICMRALLRPPDERYATAAEMRRELLVAMRDLASEEPSAELAELMTRCFPDRIGDKRVLMRNVREGSVVDHIPVGDVDVTIEIPSVEEVPVAPPPPSIPMVSSTPVTSSRPDVEPSRRKPRSSRAPLFLALVLIAGGGAASVRIVQTSRATTRSAGLPPPVAKSAEPPAPAPSIAEPPATLPESSSPPAAAAPPAPVRRPKHLPSTTSTTPPATPPAAEAQKPAPSASTRGFHRFQ